MIKLFNIRTHEWPRVSLLFLMTILTNVGSTWGLTITYAGFLKQIGMLEIISKSGGNLLEFTGDAMLIQFPRSRRQNDTAQAVRAGLRMQRGMARFAEIEIPQRMLALGMRIGVHPGRFLAADIGTPLRMVHVLLGKAVREAKKAEGSGRVGRVCLTEAAVEHIKGQFRCEDGDPGYGLVIDDLTDEQLGAYEITMPRRRSGSKVLFDRSVEGLVTGIEELLGQVEPLASFIPKPILNLLVENAAKRQIPPDFPTPTILFMNLLGLPEAIDHAQPGEEEKVVNTFLRAFALINAAVDARGGVLKRVTYHLAGSDIVICFGTPNAHTNDPYRVAETALAVRDIITGLEPLTVGEKNILMTCQIGMNCGPVFIAEIGELRGRREFTLQGDVVNTAARLMSRAAENQILLTENVYQQISQDFECEALGAFPLKGKAAPVPLFALHSRSLETG